MSFQPAAPVTGSTVTGLTSPTYTFTADVAPDATGKQYSVTTLGGTQTNVRTHTASDPFSVTMFRPKSFKTAGIPDPSSGVLTSNGKNTWKIIVRKGVIPVTGQSPQLLLATLEMSIPAGAESADTVNLAAFFSMLGGLLNSEASDLLDTVKTGIL